MGGGREGERQRERDRERQVNSPLLLCQGLFSWLQLWNSWLWSLGQELFLTSAGSSSHTHTYTHTSSVTHFKNIIHALKSG